MTTTMLPHKLSSTPAWSEMNSSFRGLLKSRLFASELFFLFFLGKGLPPGPSCSGCCVLSLSLSLRAVTMLLTVKAAMNRSSSTIG